MSKTFFTSKGTPIAMARELGKGGEGSVYEVLSISNQVAKLYHEAPDPKKQSKLSFMSSAADARLIEYVAWPQETIHSGCGGPIIGFLMPKVVSKNPIHMVYSPAHRRQYYPKQAWDFLLYVARNVAASFETVHVHGHVIGDVNQDSFMIGRDSKVVLIDSDSFQVNAHGTLHLCEVGVSHFTPPELQSLSSFDGFARTINHDCFGLALLIFHILFGGRHPFSGVPLRNGVGDALETDIKNFRYAYAHDNSSRGIGPPPRSIPVSILPDAMALMFHLAFTEQGASGYRPTAQQWITAIDGLRGRLRKCSVTMMHVYPSHLAKCPWCALEQQGVVYFVDSGVAFTQTSSGFVLAQVWGLIQAVPVPPPLNVPIHANFSVKAQPLPVDIIGADLIIFFRLVVIAIAVVIVAAVPDFWFLTLLAGFGGYAMVGNIGATQRNAETSKRRVALEAARQEYDRLVERAKNDAGPEGFNVRKAEFSRCYDELNNLSWDEKQEIDELHSSARDRQKHKFLDTYFIDSASIPGIGSARKASLRSFGIETAADVTRDSVRQVHGFGKSLTRAVLDWKASCTRRFVFNPAAAVSPADRNTVRAKFVAKRVGLEHTLAAAPGQLQQFRQQAVTQMLSLQPQFEAAALKLAQAQADLSKLT